MDADVVIAGAGPTGLMLACELQLAEVRPVVLERLAEPTGLPKALGLVGRSVDLGKLDDLRLRGVFIQQAATEEILRGYAQELGVQIRTGCELTALHQDSDGVNVEINGPQGHGQLRARFVVGCDGGASTARKQAGIDFPGLPPTVLLRLGDVTLEGDVTPDHIPYAQVPSFPSDRGSTASSPPSLIRPNWTAMPR